MIYTTLQLLFNPTNWVIVQGTINSTLAIYLLLILGLYLLVSAKFAFFHWKVTRG